MSAGPTSVPVGGATVRLKTFYNPETVVTTASDEAGNYELSYPYPSAAPLSSRCRRRGM